MQQVSILDVIYGQAAGQGAQVGDIKAFGSSTAPAGWLACDGAAISRTTYADLFRIYGVAFGAGDGVTTFNKPDLRQRLPLGRAPAGTGSTLGGTGGAIDHTHGLGTLATDPESAHTHGIGTFQTGPAGANNVVSAAADSWATPGNDPIVGTSGAGSAHNHTLSGTPGTNNPPFQVVEYYCKF